MGKVKKCTVIIFCGFLFFSALVHGKGPVWKISKGDQFIYLGGTIHVLSQNDYPLPKEFELAYNASDTLVFETDITAMSDPKIQAQLLKVMMYQDERTLSSQISEGTMESLETFLTQRNIPANSFNRFTPAGVSLTLTVLELQRLGMQATSGVDHFFSLRGKNDGKEIDSLETVSEQIGFINSLNDADGDQLLESTLRDTKTLREIWQKMLSAWRSGNLDALAKVGLAPMQKDHSNIAKILLDDRNDRWMEQFPAMFEDPDVEFVLVGALHMAGEQGLLAQLKSAAYTIEQLSD